MLIRKEEYRDVLDYLQRNRWEGQEFVAFPNSFSAIHKEELSCFPTDYEAQEFCYEMATDQDKYGYLAIRSAYRAMAEANENHSLLIEKHGSIDVSMMVANRYQRLENEQLINNNQKIKIMNDDNVEYLSNQVKYSGFGDNLTDALKSEIAGKKPAFTLVHQPEFGDGDVKATLHFRRSEETGMVFFNRYELEVKQSADTLKQTFYMGKENNFTLKEAFNLMSGQSVYKELEKLQKVGEGQNARYEGTGEKYNAWVQLDFEDADSNGQFKMKYYHDNYGFNLPDELAKQPIKELDDVEKKAQMIRSLERGNLHTVTYIKDGEEHKGSIKAVPQFKTVKLFDESGKEVRHSEDKKQDQNQSSSQSKKKTEKQSAGDDENSKPQKKQAKKRGAKM
ncbi:hypothetical protein [Pedobacter insulae]|uniref:DUF3945 domain-containing protein n=1 Tax=Pedobacter insulae TaxID=414048 RepID=A0A1I2ZJU9_9SPHI|nr:hypothetical protein [Pedobacter insulae]SFH38014.1 hypothetical protein SAMN04489864_11082 [Pedobacter insulae]